MWQKYLKLDAYVLSKVQDAYLWALDRTGIYVATISFVVYAGIVIMCLSKGYSVWVWLPLLGFVGFSLGPKYLMQDRAENERFNVIAMLMQSSWWRHPLQMSMALFAFIGTVDLDPLEFAIDSGFILYFYLALVMIRDRDKKPFFAPAETQELAMQHGSD
jgi:hypothetical protein